MKNFKDYCRLWNRNKKRSRTGAALTEYRKKRLEGKRIYRAKKYGSGGRHSEAQWQALLSLFGNKCLRCGTARDISRDHVIPLTRGGSDDISNIQPLCRLCNSIKKDRTIDFRAIALPASS